MKNYVVIFHNIYLSLVYKSLKRKPKFNKKNKEADEETPASLYVLLSLTSQLREWIL